MVGGATVIVTVRILKYFIWSMPGIPNCSFGCESVKLICSAANLADIAIPVDSCSCITRNLNMKSVHIPGYQNCSCFTFKSSLTACDTAFHVRINHDMCKARCVTVNPCYMSANLVVNAAKRIMVIAYKTPRFLRIIRIPGFPDRSCTMSTSYSQDGFILP